MIAVLAALFLAFAVLAMAFVAIPAFRAPAGAQRRPRALRTGVSAMAVLLVGFGAYGVLGRPDLALRALTGPDAEDYEGMIAVLAQRIRDRPYDLQGWSILGRGYLAFGETNEAAQALQHALALARARPEGAPADMLVDYGLALALSSGQVTAEAESVLREALAADPSNIEARYYLGIAYAERGENEAALSILESLAADGPADAPWRPAVMEQIAALRGTAEAGPSVVPDIPAMVERLAARLSAEPDDLEGWLMLIRSYTQLGETEQARTALATARRFFAGNDAAEEALATQARASALE